MSHFSKSLTQQERAIHRSTVARRNRCDSAREGRSTRRRYIGAQLLVEVAVDRRGGSQQDTALHRSTIALGVAVGPRGGLQQELTWYRSAVARRHHTQSAQGLQTFASRQCTATLQSRCKRRQAAPPCTGTFCSAQAARQALPSRQHQRILQVPASGRRNLFGIPLESQSAPITAATSTTIVPVTPLPSPSEPRVYCYVKPLAVPVHCSTTRSKKLSIRTASDTSNVAVQ